MRAWLLLAAAVATTIVAAALTLSQLREADAQRRTRTLASDADYMVRNQVHALHELVDELAERWHDEFPHERAQLAVAELGATVIAYENDSDDGRPGYVGQIGPDRPFDTDIDALPENDRIPDPIWRRFGQFFSIESAPQISVTIEPVRASPLQPTGGSFIAPFEPTFVWLSTGKDGKPRVNMLQPVFVMTDGWPPVSQRRMRFMHLSKELRMPDEADVEVLCDIKNGELGTSLQPAGTKLSGYFESVMDPARLPWSFPLETDDRARIRLGSVAPQRPTPTLIGVWLLAVALLAASVLALRRVGRAQLSAAALEASHELRTPLTVLRGEIEVALRRERSGEDYRTSLQTALDEVEGLQHMVTSLLTLGARAKTQHFESVDVAALAAERVVSLQAREPEREITIEAASTARVQGDANLLERAIDNLLENAARHSVTGGRIRVSVHTAGSTIELAVEDDGPGVPAPRARKIFDRFYRGPASSRRQSPGAGLGLAVVRWIAELHRGSVELDPEVTERARFVIKLPAA